MQTGNRMMRYSGVGSVHESVSTSSVKLAKKKKNYILPLSIKKLPMWRQRDSAALSWKPEYTATICYTPIRQ